MRNYIILIIWLLACAVGVQAQTDERLEEGIVEFYATVPQEKLYIQTDKPYYIAGDSLWFRVHLVDAATNIPSTSPSYPDGRSKYVYVELHDNATDALIERAMIKRDSLGVFSNALQLADSLPAGNYTLIAYTRHMIQFGSEHFARKQFAIAGRGSAPETPQRPLGGIAISALPEGGNLIAGFRQQLAFKAVGDDGLGVDVSVRLVRDSDGEVLDTASSTHLGMGSIWLVPKAGEKLRLEAYARGGFSCSTPVPEALENGVTMHVDQRNDNLYVTPIVSGIDPSTLTLVVYGSGNVISRRQLTGKPLSIGTARMSPGVVNVAIVDTAVRRVWSERLVFIYPHDDSSVSLSLLHSRHSE